MRELHLKNRKHEVVAAARVEERRLFGLWTVVLWEGGSVVERARATYDTARAHREDLETETVTTENVEGANDEDSSITSDIAFSAGKRDL